MLKITNEIFVFKNIMDNKLISILLKIREESKHTDRINLNEVNMDVFHQLNNFWIKNIEPKIMDEYFSVYDVENNIGFNVSEETIANLKNWNKTKWRDVYLLNYNKSNQIRSEKDVHWDFSGLSFVGCLTGDYEGGSLRFPRHNIEYKLNVGDIIVFPGGITHPHCVSRVTDGERNVIIGQSLRLDENPKIIY